MDRFVERSRQPPPPQSHSQLPVTQAGCESTMADATREESMEQQTPSQTTGTNVSPHIFNPSGDDSQYIRIAEAVAALLKPTINEAVEKAVSQGIVQLKKEMGAQGKRLQEAELRIASLEEELQQANSAIKNHDLACQIFQEKLTDLENRSRRNNLRIIGLPESFTPAMLPDLCATKIPNALGFPTPCVVERAHRIGPPAENKTSPRPTIVRYLNYADKHMLLQRFRQQKQLQIEGHKLLLFADYSQEVSNKRKAFSRICSTLFHNNIKFTLAYPAILHVTSKDGDRISLHTPVEAEQFLQANNIQLVGDPPSARKATLTRKSQNSPRKDLTKKVKFGAFQPRENAT